MDKEKILAAKKKLREFQRSQINQMASIKKEQEMIDLDTAPRSELFFDSHVNNSSNGIESNDQPTFSSNSSDIPYTQHENCAESIPDNQSFITDENAYLKQVIESLQQELYQSRNRFSEMEDMKSQEISSLREKLQAYEQTTEILVLEKAELLKSNAHYESVVEQKTGEVADLYSKLKASNLRVDHLERELEFLKADKGDSEKSQSELEKSCQHLSELCNILKKEKDDIELEKSELVQKLELRNNELAYLQHELQEKMALLSLSELRVQQLTNSPQPEKTLEQDHQTTVMLNQQLAQTQEALRLVRQEKDEAGRQYQVYLQQLDEKLSQLSLELESSKKVISEAKVREQSYVERLSDLEIQLQREKSKPIVKTEDSQPDKVEELTKSLDNLVLEQGNLHMLIQEKDEEIDYLKKSLQEAQTMVEQPVEAAKLAEALQSEQLGASRAVSQNKELKKQLEEMHDAFIQLSNTKLDLTEQLQAERVIGRKLNARLNEMEQQLSDLTEQLKEKEKDNFNAAQIQDQIQHYQATSQNTSALQDEIKNSQTIIDSLKKENEILRSQLHSLGESPIKTVPHEPEKIISHSKEIMDIKTVSEALEKLEKKFKESMERVADLTDEKQGLEHLVLQLQGETETIGEYVTLYQKQRAILHERAQEKEHIYRQLLDQRNSLQEQLHKLKILVADLLKPNSSVFTGVPAEENMPLTDSTEDEERDRRTASRILELLSEIKDCSDSVLSPNFHPCPWCSGKLITV